MSWLFIKIYDFFSNKRPLLWSILAVLIILLGSAATRINFKSDIEAMIPQDEKIAALNNYLQRTEGGEKIIFSISSPNIEAAPEQLINHQQSFVELLTLTAQEHIASISTQQQGIDEWTVTNFCNTYLPLLLTDADYASIKERVQPDNIAKYLEKQKQLLQTPAGAYISNTLPSDPLGLNLIGLEKFSNLQPDSDFELINNYLFSKNQQKLIFFLNSKYPNGDTKNNVKLLNAIRESSKAFAKQNPNIEVSYFGAALVGAENAQQMQQDTILTLSITIVALLAFIIYTFKRKRTSLLLTLPVLFGMLFSMGIVALTTAYISILALAVGAIILGIALDFSIHYLNHAKDDTSTKEDIAALAMPLSLGAATTVGAFLILLFANSAILRDIGIFASLALIGASAFTLLFLPHIVDISKIKNSNKQTAPTLIDRLAKWQPEKKKYILIAILILTPILGYFANDVKFNGNMMDLNFMSEDMKKAEASFHNDAQQTLRTIYVIAKGTDPNNVIEQASGIQASIDSLKKAGLIAFATQPSLLLKSEQQAADAHSKWNSFWKEANIASIQEAIDRGIAAVGMNPDVFVKLEDFITQKQYTLDTNALAMIKTIMPTSIALYKDTTAIITSIKVRHENRNAVLQQLTLHQQLLTVDNQSIVETLVAYLNTDFDNLAFFSGLLVFLALLIAYGRLELALISFLPMAIAWIWILGIMGVFGLEFNIVNIIICTLIFGLGDDYSIFMMDGLLEKYKTGKQKLLVSRTAIYISATTTIIGLGVLIFAKHPALKSISLIAILGIGCVVIISQSLQPFLFNMLIQGRADKGKMPLTLWSLTKSVFSFTYFFIGCVLLTIVGAILTYIKPFGKEKSTHLFHYLLTKYSKSVLYIMTNTQKNYVYTDPQYYKKPAVYIANHSSFLDILITIGLHPKVVLLTADWVWNSPIMGRIVKMAEFYPATSGAEQGLEQLKRMRDRGFSIMVFPEGTRSKTDTIHKFKKGAFYLAQHLEMDIQPVIIHGVANTMEKNDFLLKDGQLNVFVADKIPHNSQEFGTTISDQRKNISRWFRAQYRAIKTSKETPRYFRETIVKSHIYKGPVLEWYCRIKTQLEDNYEHYHELLPRSGDIYDLGCGYGFMSFMLHWSSTDRRIIGIDYDEEKIATANNHYYFNSYRYKELYNAQSEVFEKGLSFEANDLTQISLAPCDAILMMDALHYLLPEQQKALLIKCYQALRPGGVFLLRDGVKEETQKHQATIKTETYSTKIFKFNKTHNELHFISKTDTVQLFEDMGAKVQCKNYSKQLSNITFIITKPATEI